MYISRLSLLNIRSFKKLEIDFSKSINLLVGKEVDNAEMNAFTLKQQNAIGRNPWLRPIFRGNRIDVRARFYNEKDPALSHLQSNYTRGADFVNPFTHEW
jgi:hypothetical protein